MFSRRLSVALALAFTSLTAFASPKIKLSATPSPREKFAASRLEAAVANLPGHEMIILAVRNE